MNDTKEKILNAALALFAQNGYEAVSVSDIAGRLGMTKGALYKHYKNKQDIFDSILAKMDGIYSKASSSWINCGDEYSTSDISPALKSVLGWCVSCFSFWTEDEFAALFRKMLILEQYRGAEQGRVHCRYLVSTPVESLTGLIRSFHVNGAAEKAFTLFSAIYLAFSVYDSADDKLCTSFILKESIERMCFDVLRDI